MPHYRRHYGPGATYFFTVVSYQRAHILTHPDVQQSLRAAIESVRETMPFTIDAWVLLPDHLHAIWTLPVNDSDFGARWSRIKARVSRECRHLAVATPVSASRAKRREVNFWQRRFWEHHIRDDQDYARHFDYIHFNPIKHKWVERARDWPYSTFHRYQAAGVYEEAWGTDPGDFASTTGE